MAAEATSSPIVDPESDDCGCEQLCIRKQTDDTGNASGSAHGTTDTTLRIRIQGKDKLSHEIEDLKLQRQEFLRQKKSLTKDLRNAEKRRQRLRKRARQLSNPELLEVLTMRSITQRRRGSNGPNALPLEAAAPDDHAKTVCANPPAVAKEKQNEP